MGQLEGTLAAAERHVRDEEGRVARQADVVERLDKAGHGRAADEAREMLAAMRASLAMARARLLVAGVSWGGWPPAC